jgi:transposase
MPASLSSAQLELLRHYFRYNDATTFHLVIISTSDIANLVQCSERTVQRLRALWKRTGDVQPVRRAPDAPKKLEELVERALV